MKFQSFVRDELMGLKISIWLVIASTPNALRLQSKYDVLDPVVQSIVSLTSSFRGQLVKCFTTF